VLIDLGSVPLTRFQIQLHASDYPLSCVLQLYYIAGYLVSQLMVRELRKKRVHSMRHLQVDWGYVRALEQLKGFGSVDNSIDEERIPIEASEWQQACAHVHIWWNGHGL